MQQFLVQTLLSKAARRTARRSMVFALSVLILALGSSIASQSQTAPDETYRRVVELLYGRPDESIGDFEYKVTLRFEPDYTADSQIVIEKRLEKDEYSIVLLVPENSESTLSQSIKLSEVFGNNPQEIAKRIRIKRIVCKVPKNEVERIISWVRKYKEKLWVDTELYLSGTTYELTIVGPSESIHVVRVGYPAEEDSKNPPLIQWMNRLRSRVLASTEPAK